MDCKQIEDSIYEEIVDFDLGGSLAEKVGKIRPTIIIDKTQTFHKIKTTAQYSGPKDVVAKYIIYELYFEMIRANTYNKPVLVISEIEIREENKRLIPYCSFGFKD